jgi:hypothetical protein
MGPHQVSYIRLPAPNLQLNMVSEKQAENILLFAINKTGIREFISKIQYFSDNYL